MKTPKLGFVLYGLLALNVGRSAVFDDFNGTQIDTNLWRVATPFAGSSVSESNGRAVLIQRGILNSVAAFSNSLEIRGRFRFAGSSDHFRIVFRSDQQPIDSFGGLGGMIIVMDQGGEVQIGEADISTLALGSCPCVQNQDVDFRITDDGTNVSLFFNNANDPLLSASSTYRKGNKVSFYNREITSTRVEVDYLQINSPILTQAWTNGLVAFYPFNGNVQDESGNGNDGTANNVSFVADRFGLPNGAGFFAGNSSSNVKINSTNLNLPPDFTVSVWINYAAGAGTEGPRIISTAGYEITTDSTFVTQRHINFNNTFSPGSGFANVSSSNGVPAGVWTQVVGVRVVERLNLYINGILAGSVSTTQAPNYSRGFVPEIGGNSGNTSDNYAGLIDDLRVYNRALSATEVQQLYQYELGPTIDLIKAVKPSFSKLLIGRNYQLQTSVDMVNWMNQGSPFAGTNNTVLYPQYFDVDDWSKLFFRLQVAP